MQAVEFCNIWPTITAPLANEEPTCSRTHPARKNVSPRGVGTATGRLATEKCNKDNFRSNVLF